MLGTSTYLNLCRPPVIFSVFIVTVHFLVLCPWMHCPTRFLPLLLWQEEAELVRNRGGLVYFYNGAWRVNATLSVSRSLGDYSCQQYITCEPEVSHGLIHCHPQYSHPLYPSPILAADFNVISMRAWAPNNVR